MGRAKDIVCSAHQWLKKIFNILMKRFCSKRKNRYSSSAIWRKIERRGKMRKVSINPFVNYINEYKRVFALYTKGALDLSNSRATIAGLTDKQSNSLLEDSNSENLLRNYAIKNWNSMSYKQRKPFIDLALEKRKWFKRIDERNVAILNSINQGNIPNHYVSIINTQSGTDPEPNTGTSSEASSESSSDASDDEPTACRSRRQNASSIISIETSCQHDPTQIPDACITSGANSHSQPDMSSHKESDDGTTAHRLKRKNGITNIDLEEVTQLDLPNHDGPNVVTRANRKKIMRLRKRSRAHLRHCENSPSSSELADESSDQLDPTVIPDAFITSGANFHSQHDMSSYKESDDEITAPRSNRKNGINNIDLEEVNQLDLPNHDEPNIVTRAKRKKIRKPKKRSKANLRYREDSHSFTDVEEVSSARNLNGKNINNKRPCTEEIKPSEETKKNKKQYRKNRYISEEVQITPKREQRKKSGTVIPK